VIGGQTPPPPYATTKEKLFPILFPPQFPWFIYAYNKTLGIFKLWRKIVARKTLFPDIVARESAFQLYFQGLSTFRTRLIQQYFNSTSLRRALCLAMSPRSFSLGSA
jgi:hypothetical protein